MRETETGMTICTCGHHEGLHKTSTGVPRSCVGYAPASGNRTDCPCQAFEAHDPAAALRKIQDGLRDGTLSIVLPDTYAPENMPRRGAPQPGDGEVTKTAVALYAGRAIVIRYGIRGVGFGEVTLSATDFPRLSSDTECMDPATVAAVIRHAADKLADLLVRLDHEGGLDEWDSDPPTT